MDRSALVLHARFQRASEQPRPSSLSEFRLETILWNRNYGWVSRRNVCISTAMTNGGRNVSAARNDSDVVGRVARPFAPTPLHAVVPRSCEAAAAIPNGIFWFT